MQSAGSARGPLSVLPYFGLVSSLALDPIEKKPLHHFLPGSEVFSAGFVGCNMRCPFCQNWGISQEIPSSLERMSPESLVAAALRSGAPSIAYTYSEPTIHFEFVLASMAAARAAGLKNVLVTNGCLEPAPARELLSLTDAANVDLKTWSAETYRKTLGGSKDRVLEFMGIAASLCHLEVTTLVVPPFSDSIERRRGDSGLRRRPVPGHSPPPFGLSSGVEARGPAYPGRLFSPSSLGRRGRDFATCMKAISRDGAPTPIARVAGTR